MTNFWEQSFGEGTDRVIGHGNPDFEVVGSQVLQGVWGRELNTWPFKMSQNLMFLLRVSHFS